MCKLVYDNHRSELTEKIADILSKVSKEDWKRVFQLLPEFKEMQEFMKPETRRCPSAEKPSYSCSGH